MRILILEDEPLIAMDLEDIVMMSCNASCVHAATAEAGMLRVAEGVDFALLDVNLGRDGATSLPVASSLMERSIPFCFVSASLDRLPDAYRGVPRVSKPFRQGEIENVLAGSTKSCDR